MPGRAGGVLSTLYAGLVAITPPAASGQPAQWTPQGWRGRAVAQQPDWPDDKELQQVVDHLSGLPPLVFAGEARRLRESLSKVADGQAFLLQAGDCAESFDEFSADGIRDKLKIILQMAVVLTYAAGVPVVKVGRIAGQFAKPRSSPTETVGADELPSFRGHMVNDDDFDAAARRPDPERIIAAYHQSASTLNLLRAFTKGGFAALSQVHAWNQEFVASSSQGQHYEQMAGEIDRALRFMDACGVPLTVETALQEVDFWTSHEALVLPYEEALTRRDSLTGDWYDCSAHMVWIGDRTRQPEGGHVEFLAGVHNPLGCKIGPTAATEDVLRVCERLDPERRPGRLTLITRLGQRGVEERLPALLTSVKAEGHPVVWVCDPMHGNTFTSNGRKTRRFGDILAELRMFFEVHQAAGTWPGGVHIELTGDDVTECLGGAEEVLEGHLDHRYTTACDPRLNARQSLDLAFGLAELLRS